MTYDLSQIAITHPHHNNRIDFYRIGLTVNYAILINIFSPKNIVKSRISFVSQTLHKKFSEHSPIIGALPLKSKKEVNKQDLSVSLPETIPQKSISLTNAAGGMLTLKQPLCAIPSVM